MRFLYVVFVASIAALLWAAYAVARTIRRQRAPGINRKAASEEHASRQPGDS